MEGGIAAMTTVEEGLYDVCVYIMTTVEEGLYDVYVYIMDLASDWDMDGIMSGQASLYDFSGGNHARHI